jgi:hypothetical protein
VLDTSSDESDGDEANPSGRQGRQPQVETYQNISCLTGLCCCCC